MREVNKYKKKKAEQEKLTASDFMAALGDTKVELFMNMLRTETYAFKIKKYLFENKKLSVRGFLYNDSVFNLKLGKKDDKGNILIDNGIIDIFDRYMFSSEMAKNGDALTAFLIDHDDKLHEILKENTSKEKKMTEDDYVKEFSQAYNRVDAHVLNSIVNNYIEGTPTIVTELMGEPSETPKK